MKRKNQNLPRCVCSHRRATHFKGYFGCLGRYVDDKGRVVPCPCKAYKASDQPKAFGNAPSLPKGFSIEEVAGGGWMILKDGLQWGQGPRDSSGASSQVWPTKAAAISALMSRRNAPYKRSGDLKGPRQMLSAPWAGTDSPQRLRPIKNPLTVKEQAQLLHSAKFHAQMAKQNFERGNERQARFDQGYSEGLTKSAIRYGGTESRRKKDVFGFQTPKWRASKTAQKIRRIYRKNHAPGKLIGPRCILIRTNAEEMKINTAAPIYGLKDGSVFIKGFFSRAPRGNVTRIEYMDDAKAGREGLKEKGIPWRHDFTAEKKPISKVRGGLLIRAGKRPLWGMR